LDLVGSHTRRGIGIGVIQEVLDCRATQVQALYAMTELVECWTRAEVGIGLGMMADVAMKIRGGEKAGEILRRG